MLTAVYWQCFRDQNLPHNRYTTEAICYKMVLSYSIKKNNNSEYILHKIHIPVFSRLFLPTCRQLVFAIGV